MINSAIVIFEWLYLTIYSNYPVKHFDRPRNVFLMFINSKSVHRTAPRFSIMFHRSILHSFYRRERLSLALPNFCHHRSGLNKSPEALAVVIPRNNGSSGLEWTAAPPDTGCHGPLRTPIIRWALYTSDKDWSETVISCLYVCVCVCVCVHVSINIFAYVCRWLYVNTYTCGM